MSGVDPNGGGPLLVPGGATGSIAASSLSPGTAGQGIRTNAGTTAGEWFDPDIVCTVAELATTYAPSAVLRGVIAYTTDAGATYVCRRTAASTYAWALLAAGATAALARTAVLAAYDPGSPALDASTLYAWRCDDAAGAGSIAEANGAASLALTGSTWVQGDGGLYASSLCALLGPGAAVSDRAVSPSTLALPSGAITIEVDFQPNLMSLVVGGTSLTELAVFARSGATRYVTIRLSASGGQVHSATSSDGGAEVATGAAALPLSRLGHEVPHHLMAVAIPGTSLTLYCDGVLVSSVAIPAGSYAGSDVSASLGGAGANAAPIGRFGELRLSDVARDAAYARTAYAALRARS